VTSVRPVLTAGHGPPTVPGCPSCWWRVEAFRAYASYMRTLEFRHGLDDLLEATADTATLIMCSESSVVALPPHASSRTR
jgi:hypothetical protein